jgi:phage-related protein
MKDNFEQMAGTLSKPIFDFLAEQLSKIMPFIESVASSLSENGLMGTIQRFAPGIMPYIESAIGIFDNLKNAVKRILDAIKGFWDEHSNWLMPLISFVWDFICNVISNTINAIASVIEAGLGVIDGIINFFQNLFSGNFSACWESIKQIFSNAIKLIWNWMQVQFVTNIPNMIKNFATNIPGLIKGMWTSAKDLFNNGVIACINFIKNLLTNASSNFGTLKTFGANTFQALWSVAKTMMSNLLNAVISNIKQVPTNIQNFMNQAVNVIKGINLVQIGKSMIQGLINGIKSMGSSVVGAIGSVVKSAVSSAKKALGINSPSRVFRQIGDDTGEGLVLGLKDKETDIIKASQNLSTSVIGGYNARINTNFTKGNSKPNNQNISSSQDSPIIVNTILDGKTIAQTIASYSDVVSGNRMNLAERGLAL